MSMQAVVAYFKVAIYLWVLMEFTEHLVCLTSELRTEHATPQTRSNCATFIVCAPFWRSRRWIKHNVSQWRPVIPAAEFVTSFAAYRLTVPVAPAVISFFDRMRCNCAAPLDVFLRVRFRSEQRIMYLCRAHKSTSRLSIVLYRVSS
jgi:hypothetical protein